MQQKFRYDCSGQWLKGALHVHTTVSDGGQTPLESARAYAEAGFDFMALTDHDVASDATAEDHWPLTVLDGVELAGADGGTAYHALCLGRFPDLPHDDGYAAMLDYCHEQGGVVIVAHPQLMLHTREDVLRRDYDGVEVYNGLGDLFCRTASNPHWEWMLDRDPEALGIAVDDAHGCGFDEDGGKLCPYWNCGWVVVNAPDRSREAIFAAIRAGNFYSSTGPDFKSIEWTDDGRIVLRTSPVRRAWLVGGYWQAHCKGMPPAGVFTEIEFDRPEGWPYFRAEIEDEQGRRAWTNSLLIGG